MALAFLAERLMPAVEGRLSPVVAPAALVKYSKAPPPSYRNVWQAQANKLRGCEYVLGSLRWYLGPVGGRRVQVVAAFLDPPQVRTEGLLEWQGLQIDLDPELVKTNSHATVRHRCPWRFWEVESVFFTSDQKPEVTE
ncbi:hypothetical protein [uncultured Roseobacter sp.]|uniref:hypothetical protein n=1 Tax=uncultured Roseobacter sp. TaxID=114847 RepID=UPI0026377698|nr:hypothetical protein [uncultured Roseobacter sp.]